MIKRIYRDEIHFRLDSKDIFESYVEIFKNRGAKIDYEHLEDRYVLYAELEINMENLENEQI